MEIIETVLPNGDREWRLNGKLHREDGPAVIDTSGAREWWQKW